MLKILLRKDFGVIGSLLDVARRGRAPHRRRSTEGIIPSAGAAFKVKPTIPWGSIG